MIYFFKNAMLSDLTESSGDSSKTLHQGLCSYKPLNNALLYKNLFLFVSIYVKLMHFSCSINNSSIHSSELVGFHISLAFLSVLAVCITNFHSCYLFSTGEYIQVPPDVSSFASTADVSLSAKL